MTINLSSEGIFPITFDKDGNKLFKKPKTGLEYPGTIQGEGRLMGVPSLFIRTSACNLRCIFQNKNFIETCDTPYTSWNNKNFKYKIQDVIDIIDHNTTNGINHIVITGGEPLIQKEAIVELCNQIKKQFDYHITIETNGTIFIEELLPYIDLFSISPKLSNSNPTKEKIDTYNKLYNKNIQTKIKHNQIRYNIEVLKKYINWNLNNVIWGIQSRIQLKFVVDSSDDIIEIKKNYINQFESLNNSDIYLMPLGMTPETLKMTTNIVIEECIKNNWNLSGRLHINLFDDNFGV